MKIGNRLLKICSCEGSMQIDAHCLAKTFGGDAPPIHQQLCRAELPDFEDAIAGDGQVLVACTQEAALFQEIASEAARAETDSFAKMGFVNIRELAGWSENGSQATPKIAALLAETAVDVWPAELLNITSDGLCVVYGAGQTALDAAQALSGRLSVTLVLSTDGADLALPMKLDFPIYAGRIRSAAGSLGGFELTLDGYGPMAPSSRAELDFPQRRDGAQVSCSVVVDLSGQPPLFSHSVARDGYLRADPGSPSAVMRAVFKASDLIGEFEKPIYTQVDTDICAHMRAGQVGCTKCLDTCPAGAITELGDAIAIDPAICGGCGGCAALCPTGAIAYRYPQGNDLIKRIQALGLSFAEAGGANPILLVHDERFGGEVITMMARFGRGLPAHVIPMSIHAVSMVSHIAFATAFTAGFERVVMLLDPGMPDTHDALQEEAALITEILSRLGYDPTDRVIMINERDPEAVTDLLYDLQPMPACARTRFTASGGRRETARIALGALAEAAPERIDVIALPPGAPYGRIHLDQEACTLCLACVSTCPADALGDNPDKPTVRFTEAACVQCGICAAACPESAITLEPRLNLAPDAMQPETLHEEEPFECTECGKAFASKSTIARITQALAGHHSMYQSEERIAMLQMCEDCRVKARAASSDDPFASGARPRIRTTEDYLRAEAAGLSVDDFLKD